MSNEAGHFQEGRDTQVINPAAREFGNKIVPVPDKNQTKLRTIPNSNLSQRKTDVLRIHKENLKMVSKLSEMKANQELLVSMENDKAAHASNFDMRYRSRSANATKRDCESVLKAGSATKNQLKTGGPLNSSMDRIDEVRSV